MVVYSVILDYFRDDASVMTTPKISIKNVQNT